MDMSKWALSPPTYTVSRKLQETKRERLEGGCILIRLDKIAAPKGSYDDREN